MNVDKSTMKGSVCTARPAQKPSPLGVRSAWVVFSEDGPERPKAFPIGGPQRPENRPVACFQRGRAGRPRWWPGGPDEVHPWDL